MTSKDNPQQNFPGRLLVIDDDPVLLAAMLRLLRGAGYQAEGAVSASEGLELARCDPPDMILLDLVMPEIDGMELCRQIRNEPRLKNTAIVLTSSFRTSATDQAEGFALGIVEFIPRPVENQEFLARIQARMNERRQADRWRANHAGLMRQVSSLQASL